MVTTSTNNVIPKLKIHSMLSGRSMFSVTNLNARFVRTSILELRITLNVFRTNFALTCSENLSGLKCSCLRERDRLLTWMTIVVDSQMTRTSLINISWALLTIPREMRQLRNALAASKSKGFWAKARMDACISPMIHKPTA